MFMVDEPIFDHRFFLPDAKKHFRGLRDDANQVPTTENRSR